MKTFKKKFYLFIFLFITTVTFGQNTPFKFKNNNNEKANTKKPDIEAFKKYNDSIKSDSTDLEEVVVSTILNTNYYTKLSNNFENLANNKKTEIEKLYAYERQKLLIELDKGELDERKFKKIKTELEELDDQMLQDKKIVSELMKYSLEMKYKARNSNKLIIFPVRNSIDAQLYYDYYVKDKKSQFLKNSVISYSSDGGKASLYNELFADYFGPIRFGVGALVSNKETKTIDSLGVQQIDSISLQKDAVQRLLGGGGNIVFNVSYPLLGYQNTEKTLLFKMIAAPKFSFDVPKLGTENKDYSFNYDLGIEGSLFYTGVLNALTFYGNFRIGMISGNKLFYEYLNKENNSFFFNQTSIGIALNSTFRISWNYYWGDKYVTTNFPSTISFTIVPN